MSHVLRDAQTLEHRKHNNNLATDSFLFATEHKTNHANQEKILHRIYKK